MGLSFRQSIKLGKNTRINLSKGGGIGFSTGIKGFRISTNNKGTRITASSNGVTYTKTISNKAPKKVVKKPLKAEPKAIPQYDPNAYMFNSMPIILNATGYGWVLVLDIILLIASFFIVFLAPVALILLCYCMLNKNSRQKLWLWNFAYNLRKHNIEKAKESLYKAYKVKHDVNVSKVFDKFEKVYK